MNAVVPRPAASVHPPVTDRGITLVLPGPLSRDGDRYRVFKPYGQLAAALCDRFARVVVCANVLPDVAQALGGSEIVLDPRVEVEPLPEPPPASSGVLRSLAFQLRNLRAVLRALPRWDVVYAFIPSYPGAVAYTANRLYFRHPAAVYLANDWEEITPYTFRWGGVKRLLFGPYRFLLTRWERWMAGGAPLVLTAGRALLDKYGGPGRPVYETAPIIEMSPADIVRRDDAEAGSPVRLLYVGGLQPRKGVPVLLEAAASLARAGRRLRLDIVGDGADRAALEARAAQLPAGAEAVFHGYVPNGPELYAHYRRADVFVLPTYSEGFPRVLYEALGHSVPVVATAVSGIPYLLEEGRHALLVPPGDASALAGAIARASDDVPLRRRLMDEGVALVEPILARDPATQFLELCVRHLSLAAHPARGGGAR